jgi:dTMP kinase
LDVEPAEGLKRARGRGELDRIEQENIQFFERTRERYLRLASEDPNTCVIDTMQSIENVHEAIKMAISSYLGE